MNKVFILLFLICTNIIAADISKCKIMAIGGIIEKKDNNPYFVLENKENLETYFSIKAIRLDNCHLAIDEILTRKIQINQNSFQIKKDRECEIEGYLTVERNSKKTKLLLSSVNYLFNIRAKAKVDNDYTKTKIQLKKSIKGRNHLPHDDENNHRFRKYTEGKKLYSEHITHVLATVKNQTVLNLWRSRNFSWNPIIKFKFKNIKGAKTIELITTNNKGLKRRQEIPIYQPKQTMSGKSIITPVILQEYKVNENTEVFEANTVEEAIRELYGSIDSSVREKINLVIEEPVISCQTHIPIHITSNIDLESISLFTDKTPNPVVAIFSNPTTGTIDYKFNIQIHAEGDCTFTVIGKGRDGKIYKTVKKSLLPYSYDGCL